MTASQRPYIDPTSAAADALGAAAEPAPPASTPSWQQASSRPRTGPVRRAPPAPTESAPVGSYFGRHWRGEQSLVRSYWVNHWLVAVPLALLLTGLMSWISVKGASLQLSAIVVLLGMPLLLALDVWSLVGAWRAATRYLAEQGSRLWGWLARITLALGALHLAATVLLGLLPELPDYWQLARGIDPLGHAKFSLSADGRSLRLDGVIGMGDGDRLGALLASDAARGLKRVELASPGGRVHEAERMAAAMKRHGHAARAVGTCASACTLVFLGGQQRQLAPEGRLGFHRASTGTFNPVFDELANQHLARSYRALGLPEPLITRTLDTPSSGMWFAPRAELVTYGLIAPSPQTLAIALPGSGEAATIGDFEDTLRLHPVWAAVERRYLGTIAAAAQRMLTAHAAGAPADAVQLAAHMPELIGGPDAQLRRRYLQLVALQLRALRAPGCRALLDGQLAVRALLPVELQAREAQWILDAATGQPPRWLPKPPTAVELEVLDRTTGRVALGLLSRLWTDAPGALPAGGGGCDGAVTLLERLERQPIARRELAERLLFQTRS